MSDTPASLRRKMDGAAKVATVVRTMKAVAASSIGQYEMAVRALADYERTVMLGLSACLRRGGLANAPSNRTNQQRLVAVIAFGSDQGLVGPFNEAMADYLYTKLAELPGEKTVWAVGERLHSHLAESGHSLKAPFAVPNSVATITSLVTQLQLEVEGSPFSEVYLFHTQPVVGGTGQPVCQKLLPLDTAWQKQLARKPWPTRSLPEVVGSETALHAFVREYLCILLFKACAESLAAENASRLSAMQRAEKNIDTLQTNLKRTFYRLRQNAIDAELFDVIAGFNALPAKPKRERVKIHAK